MNAPYRIHLDDPHGRIRLHSAYGRPESPGAEDYARYEALAHRLRSDAFFRALERPARAVGRHVIAPLRRWRRARATYHALAELDDRLLKDIGVSRSDIRAISQGAWDTGGDIRQPETSVELVVENTRRDAAAVRSEATIGRFAA